MWAWTTRAPVRRTACATSSGVEAAAQHPGRRPGPAEQRRVTLEQLSVLAEPVAHEPHEILDRSFLAPRRPVARVEEEDHAANLDSRPAMRVAVVAEFYPRAHDPVLGVWAHRQACAVRDAGADVSVFVLHRVVPPASAFTAREFRRLLAQPHHARLDGVPVTYIRYISPPRSRGYATWGAWAAPALRRALRRAADRADAGFDLIHAHNAVPPGDAALRAAPGPPLIVSVHGGDVLWTVDRVPRGAAVVTRTLRQADLVLANSHGIAELSRRYGAARTQVLHLGTDVPRDPPGALPDPAARHRRPPRRP